MFNPGQLQKIAAETTSIGFALPEMILSISKHIGIRHAVRIHAMSRRSPDPSIAVITRANSQYAATFLARPTYRW